jgi:hypothetical protein
MDIRLTEVSEYQEFMKWVVSSLNRLTGIAHLEQDMGLQPHRAVEIYQKLLRLKQHREQEFLQKKATEAAL